MKTFFQVAALALLAGAMTVQAVKFCSPQQPDMGWLSDNAETLLFAQYLRQEAASDPDSPWNTLTKSQEFQDKLAALRARLSPKVEDNCVPLSVNDRLEALESRPVADEDVPVDGEVSAKRINRLEQELRKHRAVLLRFRQGAYKTPETRTIEYPEPYERKSNWNQSIALETFYKSSFTAKVIRLSIWLTKNFELK